MIHKTPPVYAFTRSFKALKAVWQNHGAAAKLQNRGAGKYRIKNPAARQPSSFFNCYKYRQKGISLQAPAGFYLLLPD